MRKLKEISKLKLPTWALCPLVNGDYSDLTKDENFALASFEKQYPQDKFVIDYGREEYFSHLNDLDNLGGQVVDCKIFRIKKQSKGNKMKTQTVDKYNATAMELRFLGPTTSRATRVKVVSQHLKKSKTVSWHHAYSNLHEQIFCVGFGESEILTYCATARGVMVVLHMEHWEKVKNFFGVEGVTK